MVNALVVFGTRPEAIKMAPVIRALRNDALHFNVKVCATGQHRDMLGHILDTFDVKPDWNLSVMRAGQSLADLTSNILSRINLIIGQWRPDIALVQGDTTTALSASLACFYNNVLVGHVEAGLRTYDLQNPWPEEANRQLITRLASWHFAPTERAKGALMREGVPEQRIIVTGNTVIDALNSIARNLPNNGTTSGLASINSILDSGNRLILVTGHRRESFGGGLQNMCEAVLELARKHQDIEFIYPVHLNPNVQKVVNLVLRGERNIHILRPLDYVSFVSLMVKSYLIITDSGGIQEEAPALGTPVLVTRTITERTEAVLAGGVELVGHHKENLVRAVELLLTDRQKYQSMAEVKNCYGDGHAAVRIVDFLRHQAEHSAPADVRTLEHA